MTTLTTARPTLRFAPSHRSLTRTLRRVPRAGWLCCLLAFISAGIWSVALPPFQVPDEPMHFSYAQYLAETGKPPPGTPATSAADFNGQFSPQENAAVNDTFTWALNTNENARGVFTPSQEKLFKQQMAARANPVGVGGQTDQTNQPPLYYALEAVAYWLSPSSNILARLAVMRLVSAALLAGTVLAIFLFLRELLPRTPWAWTLGALAVAFQPQVNSIAGGVNSDNLMYFASATTILALTRAYRHGLSRRRAIAIGTIVAVGLLSKLTYWGLTPGVACAVAVSAARTRPRATDVTLIKRALLAGVIAIAPFLVYGILNVTAWHRGGFLSGGIGTSLAGAAGAGPSTAVTLQDTLEYIWVFYLPRLWFMHTQFPGMSSAHTIWINGFIGLFGSMQYSFPAWVYTYGQYVLYGTFWLAIVACVRRWRQLRQWLPLALCVLLMAAGLIYEIGYAGVQDSIYAHAQFEQARYLFPLLALYGLMVALAAKALPSRWAPVLGSVLLLIVMAHDLFGLTLTISRYYG